MPMMSTTGITQSSVRPTRRPSAADATAALRLRFVGRVGRAARRRTFGDEHRGRRCVAANRIFVGDAHDDDGDVVDTAGAVRGVDQTCRRARRIVLAPQLGAEEVVVQHVGEAVGAEEDAIAGRELYRVHVDVDAGLRAERAGDDVAHRVHRRVFGGEPPVVDELLHATVIDGDLAELAVVQQVRARVAHMADEERVRRLPASPR